MAYQQALWGCTLRRPALLIKLQNYRDWEAELETHSNPFSFVVLVHLKAPDAARDVNVHYACKW